jgi:hypothetical protein
MEDGLALDATHEAWITLKDATTSNIDKMLYALEILILFKKTTNMDNMKKMHS